MNPVSSLDPVHSSEHPHWAIARSIVTQAGIPPGKSTLFKLLTRDLIPADGEVQHNPRLRIGETHPSHTPATRKSR